jgi:aryl-alcohol dehydrogenase-like predicted oxidoreductase
MIHRTIEKTGWSVGAIGFGAWGIGGQWGAVEERSAIDALRVAVDVGMNFFDTADAYGEPQGTSEELMGKALGGVRGKILIATKAGNWGRRFGHPLPYTHHVHVEGCCDASLHRLRTDYIDLYQNHIGNAEHADVFLEAFDRLLKKGKIRAFGISTGSVEAVRAMNRDGRCAAVQLEYSLLSRSAANDLLPFCGQNRIATIIRGPLAQGVLAGKFTAQTQFEDEVRRKWNSGQGRDKFLQQVAAVDKLRWLARPGRTLAQAALGFVISHPAVTIAIPGAKNVEQVRSNAAAGDASLSAEELTRAQQCLG